MIFSLNDLTIEKLEEKIDLSYVPALELAVDSLSNESIDRPLFEGACYGIYVCVERFAQPDLIKDLADKINDQRLNELIHSELFVTASDSVKSVLINQQLNILNNENSLIAEIVEEVQSK